jgi:hypothetical protein
MDPKKRNRPILIFILASMLAFSGCGPQTGTADPTMTPRITPSATASPTAAGQATNTPVVSGAAGKIITLADQGSTITLSRGDTVLLNLGEAYTWDITVSDPNVISREPNLTVVRGAQGVYAARQSGTAVLTAAGDPLCRQAKPACGMPSIQFKITVLVK